MTAAGGLASFRGGYLVRAHGEQNRRGRRVMVLTVEPELEIAGRDHGTDALNRLPVDDDRDCPVLDDRSHGVHVRGAALDEIIIRRGAPNRRHFVACQFVESGRAIGKSQSFPIVLGRIRPR
jgi:hypothetical protein